MKLIKASNCEKYIMVDDEDYDYLNQFNWTVYLDYKKFYAHRNVKKKIYKMHRVILNIFDKNISVDHIDGDGLNNQKANLRACTQQQNSRNRSKQRNNSSGFKGVTWHKGDKKWQAQVLINRKMKYLGSFSSAEEAAKVYDEFVIKTFKEFAITNFPKENYAKV